jgi:hypothetical protein
MQQLNYELLSRLKTANAEIVRLKLLLEGNGKEEGLSEGSPHIEEGKGEEQADKEAEKQEEREIEVEG